MKKKRSGLILSLLGIIGLIVITAGVTYAFFNYAKQGTTDNSITTGTITFLYTEVSGVGKGISINDAYPISDSQGKVQTGLGNVFDFKVTSNTPNRSVINYEVTARKKKDSTLDESAVKLYLTKVDGSAEEEVLLDNYSNLDQTNKVDVSNYTEKTIYNGKVLSNSRNYEQSFRLRMWIDDSIDFSQNEDGTYPYNGKTFTVTVNVYANAKVVTDADIALESDTQISSLLINGERLTRLENQDYDYETILPEGTTSATINVETENSNAVVNIEAIDSLVYSSSMVKRLSTSKNVQLISGDNYFKITVTSENKKEVNDYIVKIVVEKSVLNSADSLTVGQAVTARDGSKWHVLEGSASGVETVVLLSDYNLNSDGSYNTTCGKNINNQVYCSHMAYDPDNTNGYDETDTNNAGYFIKNTYAPLVMEVLSGTTNITVPTVYQILQADGKTFNNSSVSLSNSWLVTTSYYTKTPSSSYATHLWVIRGDENKTDLYDAKYTNIYGIRPVITTLKTNLLAE